MSGLWLWNRKQVQPLIPWVEIIKCEHCWVAASTTVHWRRTYMQLFDSWFLWSAIHLSTLSLHLPFLEVGPKSWALRVRLQVITQAIWGKPGLNQAFLSGRRVTLSMDERQNLPHQVLSVALPESPVLACPNSLFGGSPSRPSSQVSRHISFLSIVGFLWKIEFTVHCSLSTRGKNRS